MVWAYRRQPGNKEDAEASFDEEKRRSGCCPEPAVKPPHSKTRLSGTKHWDKSQPFEAQGKQDASHGGRPAVRNSPKFAISRLELVS